jgi:hypothetical protein
LTGKSFTFLNPVIIPGLSNYLESRFGLVADKGRIKDLLCTQETGTERKQDQKKDSVPHIQPSSSSYNFFHLPTFAATSNDNRLFLFKELELKIAYVTSPNSIMIFEAPRALSI